MEYIQIIIIASITSLITNSLWLYIRNRITENRTERVNLQEKKRESIRKMLDLHSKIIIPCGLEKDELILSYLEVTKSMLMWTSDEVLFSYIKWFIKTYPNAIEKLNENEKLFGNVIIEMRKEIGYKNKGDKLLPNEIVAVFKAAIDKCLI